jgi:hypothetical protein
MEREKERRERRIGGQDSIEGDAEQSQIKKQ